MKDINGTTIKVGDLIKKVGNVTYAHDTNPGETVKRQKVSKHTWIVSKIDKNKHGEQVCFYEYKWTNPFGEEIVENLPISIPKDEGGYLVVGNAKDGVNEQFSTKNKDLKIDAGSVAGKYKVLQDVASQKWKKGDIVKIHGKVSFETLEKGILEKVEDKTKHQHVLIVVDPIKVKQKIN